MSTQSLSMEATNACATPGSHIHSATIEGMKLTYDTSKTVEENVKNLKHQITDQYLCRIIQQSEQGDTGAALIDAPIPPCTLYDHSLFAYSN